MPPQRMAWETTPFCVYLSRPTCRMSVCDAITINVFGRPAEADRRLLLLATRTTIGTFRHKLKLAIRKPSVGFSSRIASLEITHDEKDHHCSG